MDQSASEAVSSFLDRACKELGRYTIAFFKEERGEWKQHGSGVLLRVADAYFVATARHVIDDALPQTEWPRMEASLVRIGALPGALGGILLNGHGIRRAVDPYYDVALVELRPADAASLQVDKRFLNLSDCDVRPLDKDDAYLLLGFPGADSIQDATAGETTSMLHGYRTQPYDGSRGEIRELLFDPESNLAFEHHPGDHRNYEGAPTGFPNPGGCSGCGIWKLNVAGKEPSEWEPRTARLIAIFHSVDPGTQTSIGTKIGYLVALLKQGRPDIKAAIDLTFPVP